MTSKEVPLDLNELEEIMDGDQALLRECFGDFIAELPQRLRDIRSSIDNEDTTALGRTAHRLKGSLKYLAAGPAAEAAYRLEMIGKTGTLDQSEEAFTELTEECERLKAYIHSWEGQ